MKGFIFDMDGTIIDNMHIHDTAWLMFLKANGIILTKAQLDEAHHGTLVQMIRRFFGEELSEDECRKIGSEKEKIYRTLIESDLHLIQGFESFLKSIKQAGHKIALATNASWPNVDFVLNNTGIRAYFDYIVTGAEVKEGKPNPEIFYMAMKALECDAEHAYIFEDSHPGIKAGLLTKAKVIALETTLSFEILEKYPMHKIIRNYNGLDIHDF
jgi:beta-phosphoglucomutase